MSIKIGIIGGGASGMMAAVAAKHSAEPAEDIQVTILERKGRLGKKILATGNGRCNLTNLSFSDSYYHCRTDEDRQKLKRCFEQFGVTQTLGQFEQMGMLTVDKNGYVYPLSMQAATVLDTLRFELERTDVYVVTECVIISIVCQRNVTAADEKAEGSVLFRVRTEQGIFAFDRLILACGSPAGEREEVHSEYKKNSPPAGCGYEYAAGLGHSLTKLYPSLVQLSCESPLFKIMAGVRCDGVVRLKIRINDIWNRMYPDHGHDGFAVFEERGELQLTDYGISGIPVFQLSRYAALGVDSTCKVTAEIDFFPDAPAKYDRFVSNRIKRYMGRTMEQLYGGLIHKKIIQALLKQAGLRPEDTVTKQNIKPAENVFDSMRHFHTTVTAARPFQHAQVCAGGIPLSEVTDRMQSVVCPGLFLTGEMLDVDGRCGGYNLQWAWTSGYLAGTAAASGSLNSIHSQ